MTYASRLKNKLFLRLPVCSSRAVLVINESAFRQTTINHCGCLYKCPRVDYLESFSYPRFILAANLFIDNHDSSIFIIICGGRERWM